jgi:hypothetical protein
MRSAAESYPFQRTPSHTYVSSFVELVLSSDLIHVLYEVLLCLVTLNKGNNKITELRTVFQMQSQNS